MTKEESAAILAEIKALEDEQRELMEGLTESEKKSLVQGMDDGKYEEDKA